MLALIILGPPGAGKGTVAHFLCQKLNIPHISTGNLLRQHARQNTEIGKASLVYTEQGRFVPDKLIFSMLFDRIEQKDCQKGHILDGFPRTLVQAETHQRQLGKRSKVMVIHLNITDQEVIKRLAHRLVCSACHTPYNLITAPPKIAMTCDRCLSKLTQRADDCEEVVMSRLVTYHKHTSPLIAYYSMQNILKTVACNRPIKEVVGEILSHLSPT